MEAVGQLTGGLAHDFNNLLTSILGSLEMVQLRIRQGRVDDLERYIIADAGSVETGGSTDTPAAGLSRRQAPEAKPTDINSLVANMEE